MTQVQESFTSTVGFGESVRSLTGKRMQLRIITPGWGSSGFYSEAMLKDAAARGVFTEGSHLYANHPTAEEAETRPERSIRDLAAALVTPGRWEGDGIYAEAEVFPPWQDVLAAMKDHIGVSIRARGFAEHGEAEGREGPIISNLSELQSVDFVTRPGRGGAITALLESAVLVEEVSDKPWSGFTQADYDDAQWTRACLVHTEGEGKGAYKLPVREPSGALNRNAVHAAAARLNQLQPASLRAGAARKLRGLYKQLGEDPPDSLKSEPTQEAAEAASTNGGPVNGTATEGTPAGGTPTTPTPATVFGTTTPPAAPVQSQESERVAELQRQLAVAQESLAVRVAGGAALAESERLRHEADQEIRRLRASENARAKTAAALAESGLPEIAFAKVTAAVIGYEGRGLPLQESGAIDDDKLKASIDAAIAAEKTYVGAVLEHAGVGAIKGLGTSGTAAMSEADAKKNLTQQFESLGLDPKLAALAAEGR